MNKIKILELKQTYISENKTISSFKISHMIDKLIAFKYNANITTISFI